MDFGSCPAHPAHVAVLPGTFPQTPDSLVKTAGMSVEAETARTRFCNDHMVFGNGDSGYPVERIRVRPPKARDDIRVQLPTRRSCGPRLYGGRLRGARGDGVIGSGRWGSDRIQLIGAQSIQIQRKASGGPFPHASTALEPGDLPESQRSPGSLGHRDVLQKHQDTRHAPPTVAKAPGVEPAASHGNLVKVTVRVQDPQPLGNLPMVRDTDRRVVDALPSGKRTKRIPRRLDQGHIGRIRVCAWRDLLRHEHECEVTPRLNLCVDRGGRFLTPRSGRHQHQHRRRQDTQAQRGDDPVAYDLPWPVGSARSSIHLLII